MLWVAFPSVVSEVMACFPAVLSGTSSPACTVTADERGLEGAGGGFEGAGGGLEYDDGGDGGLGDDGGEGGGLGDDDGEVGGLGVIAVSAAGQLRSSELPVSRARRLLGDTVAESAGKAGGHGSSLLQAACAVGAVAGGARQQPHSGSECDGRGRRSPEQERRA